jgi:hypothetical protein
VARDGGPSRERRGEAEERQSVDGSPPHPPSPPDTPRRTRVHPYQWVGLPLLFALPVLAALNVFGPARAVERLSLGPAIVDIDYPVRTRYGRHEIIRIDVTGGGAAAGTEVWVRFTGGYLAGFREVRYTPEPHAADRLAVPVPAAGRVHTLTIDARPHRYGRSRGTLELSDGTGAAAAVPLSTFIFP